jgi:hypothetical protein
VAWTGGMDRWTVFRLRVAELLGCSLSADIPGLVGFPSFQSCYVFRVISYPPGPSSFFVVVSATVSLFFCYAVSACSGLVWLC